MDEQVQMLAPEHAAGAGAGREPSGASAKGPRQAVREAKREDRKSARTDAAIARDEARGVGMDDAADPAKASAATDDETAQAPRPLAPDEALSLASVAAHARRELMLLYGRMLTHSHIAGADCTTPAVQLSLNVPASIRSDSPLGLASDLTVYVRSFAHALRSHLHITTGAAAVVTSLIDPRLDVWTCCCTSPGAIEAEFNSLLVLLRDAVDGHVHSYDVDGRLSSPPIGTAAYDAAVAAMGAEVDGASEGR